MEKNLQLLRYSVKQRIKCLKVVLFCFLLLGITNNAHAQVYYLLNSGAGNTSDVVNSLKKVDYNGSNDVTVTSSIPNPALVEVDAPNNRIFTYAAYVNSRIINVLNMTTGALINTIAVPAGIQTGNASVSAIKYDPINNWVYYITNSYTGTGNDLDAIYRSKPDGSQNTALAKQFAKLPQWLALDIPNNRVFVYDGFFSARKILTFNLTSNTVTNSAPMSNIVNAIDYDPVTDYIYYITSDNDQINNNDANGTLNDALRKIHPDGNGGEIVVKSSLVKSPQYMVLDAGNNRAFVYNGYYGTSFTIRLSNTGIYAVDLTTGTTTLVLNHASLQNTPIYHRVKGLFVPARAMVTTSAVSGISSASATLAGNVTRSDANVTTRGVVYSSSNTKPTIGASGVSVTTNGNGTGAFTASVAALSPVTTYYARAYATSTAGTAYGDVVTFTTISNNANLTSLATNQGAISPAFSSSTINYTLSVANEVSGITITPAREQANATITVNNTAVTSGSASGTISLNIGENNIPVKVTAQDGAATKTYIIKVTRAKTPQTITFAALPAKMYGDANFTPTVSASSGLTLSWSSSDTNVAAVDIYGNISIKGAGTATITASQAGSNIFLAAADVSQTLTVNKVVLTFEANAATKIYGEANPALSGTISGFINGETLATATTGTLAFTSPATTASTTGTYAVNGGGLTADNYTFAQALGNAQALTVTKATLSYTAAVKSRAYGAAEPAYTGMVTGFLNGDNLANATTGTLSFNTTATIASNVGSYPVNGAGLSSAKYDFVQAAANNTALTIGKADLTFTAATATRIYGAANPSLGGTLTGFLNGDTETSLSGTAVYSTTATATSGVGNYPVTISGLTSAKYNIVAAAANTSALSITKATLYYTANAVSNAKNTTVPPVTGTITGFTGSDDQSNATTGTPVFTTAVTSATDVGSYPVTGSGLTAANYTLAQHPGNSTAFTVFLSDNGNLSSISLSEGTLSGGFNSSVNNYTAEVSTFTTSINVTAALSDGNAKLTVNGVEVASGAASAGIPLVVGPNTIHVNVTAQNGTTTNPYTIVVTRLPSQNANLTSISANEGGLIPLPGFADAYYMNVANNVTSYELSAALEEPNATLTINGTPISGTSGTQTMPLLIGSNPATVFVRAQDGVSYRAYSVNVTRAPSVNNVLTGLSVAEGDIGTFSNDTHTYNLTVSNTVEYINITGTVADNTASLVIEGYGIPSGTPANVPVTFGTDTVRVKVYAQSGALNEFKLVVTRLRSADATLTGIEVPGGRRDIPFSSTQYAYVDTIAAEVTSYHLKPFTANKFATVTVNGSPLDFNGGKIITPQYFSAKEPVTIEVTAQDGVTKQTYVVDVIREFSKNALLASLSFVDTKFQLDQPFDPAINNYTMSTDSMPTSLNIRLRSQSINTEVRVANRPVTNPANQFGAVAFAEIKGGVTTIPISVLSYGGTTNVYTITVNRAFSANADLQALIISGTGFSTVIGGSFSPPLDTDLAVNIPYTTTGISILPGPVDAGGTVIHINGEVVPADGASSLIPLQVGDNVITIAVTSGDGTVTKTHTLHATRLPFVDVTLASLTVSKGLLSPAFSPATTTYTVPMGSSDTSIVVTPVAVSPTATITIGVDTISALKPSSTQRIYTGTNTINIRVTAADGITSRLYRVRPNVPFSPNANLYNILLSKGNISPAFTAASTAYTANVDYSTSSINISPLALEENAVITVNGVTVNNAAPATAINLNVGDNAIAISVTAPDSSSTKTYTLSINRAAAGTNAALASITLNNSALSPVFSSNTTVYTASVENTVTNATVTAAPVDSNTVIKINGTTVPAGTGHQVPLAVGPNMITFTGTAQDGVTTKDYTLTLTRQPISADATLANIYLDNGKLSPVFAPVTIAYNVSESNTTDSISIAPVLNNNHATVKINGLTPDASVGSARIALSVGTNTVTVQVTAEDSVTKKTYTLTVTRASNMDLKEIKLSPNARLVQTSTTGNVEYSTTVSPDVTSMVLTPVARDAASVNIVINGTPINSSEASAPVALNSSGPTVIIFVIADKFTAKTKKYTVTVYKTGSNNADLTSMTLDQSAVAVLGTKEAGITNYSASVPDNVSSVKIKPLAEEAHATIKINGTTVANNTLSGTIALNASGSTAINVVVTAQDGVTIRSYVLTVNKNGSNNAYLTKLKLSTGQTIATTGLLKYGIGIGPGISTIMLTPTVQESHATIMVNGITVTNNTASAAVAVNSTGTTNVNITVTAEDGVTTRSYILAVTRTGSANAKLSQINLNPGSKIIAGSTQLDYAGAVSATVSSITVTPIAQEATAVIRVNGNIVASGAKSGTIALNATGTTPIAIDVTAENGTVRNYTVTVSRTGSDNAGLSLIKLYDGTTQIATKLENSTKYTANVANAVTAIKVKPTAADAKAVIKVNGVTVANNALSQAIPLSIGDNTITVLNTAENGIATKTYTVVVTRSSMALMAISEERTNMVDKPDNDNYNAETVVVHQAVSPNGDGINEVLQIDGLSAYPQNSINIMNAAGVLVYQTKEYDTRGNVFSGYSSNNTQLKPGTYLYVLEYVDGKKIKRKTGYIILKY